MVKRKYNFYVNIGKLTFNTMSKQTEEWLVSNICLRIFCRVGIKTLCDRAEKEPMQGIPTYIKYFF